MTEMEITTRSRSRWLSWCLLAVMAGELASRITGADLAQSFTSAAMLAVVPLAWSRLGLREAYLLTLCAALTGLVSWLEPDPAATIRLALEQASFLVAFILLLSLIQEGAMTSPAIAACGRYLTGQPPGRRYFSIFLGTHFMAILFNLGTVSLLAPLIRRGVEQGTPGDPLNPVRERRQLNALLRGFAWSVIWSPTAVAPLALLALIPGIDRPRWIMLGLGLATLIMLIGWTEDRIAWRELRRQTRAAGIRRVAPPFPGRAFLEFLAICAVLLGATLAAMAVTGGTVILGLMAASPLVLTGWLLLQNGGLGAQSRAASLMRLREIAAERLPLSAPVAVTLGCSGYLGRAAAALIPADQLAAALGLDALPSYVFLTGLAVAVSLIAQFALSPIMMAVFFGSLLGALPHLPADPTLTALALSCGWALSMTCSPFATVVLVLSRVTGHSGRELTWWWNAAFSALSVAALLAVFALLTGGA